MTIRQKLFPHIDGPLFGQALQFAYLPHRHIEAADCAQLGSLFRPSYLCLADNAFVMQGPGYRTVSLELFDLFDLTGLREFVIHTGIVGVSSVTFLQGVINTLHILDHGPSGQDRPECVYTSNFSPSHTSVRIFGLPRVAASKRRVSPGLREDITGTLGDTFEFGPGDADRTSFADWTRWASKNLKYDGDEHVNLCRLCMGGFIHCMKSLR